MRRGVQKLGTPGGSNQFTGRPGLLKCILSFLPHSGRNFFFLLGVGASSCKAANYCTLSLEAEFTSLPRISLLAFGAVCSGAAWKDFYAWAERYFFPRVFPGATEAPVPGRAAVYNQLLGGVRMTQKRRVAGRARRGVRS